MLIADIMYDGCLEGINYWKMFDDTYTYLSIEKKQKKDEN